MKRIAKLNPLEWLVYALFTLLTWPILFRDGMFMDAIQYTAVAKNLSEGFGTFWFPQLSYCSIGGLKAFHEHPPLVFGIESLFFKLLGPGIFTERFYTALVGLITLLLIRAIWRKACPKEWQDMSYLPMLLWILVIEVSWSFQNNMQENTMGVFVLLSVYSYLCSNKFWGLFFGALFVMAAFLCKGLPGLFPLAFPFLWVVLNERKSIAKGLLASGFMIILFVFFIGLLLLLPEAKLSLGAYFFERVLHRITQDPVVTSRFYILWKWLQDFSIVIAFVSLVLIFKRKEISSNKLLHADFWLWISFGFCGVVPMLLTLVQRGFYMVPAFPFFAIAFAMLLCPLLMKTNFLKLWSLQMQWGLVLLIFIISVVASYFNYGKIWRERDAMCLEKEFGPLIPKGELVGADAILWDNWTFQTSLMRYHGISIISNDPSRRYYLDAPGGMLLPTDYDTLYTSKSGVRLLQKK